jgi:DUF1680 family protein
MLPIWRAVSGKNVVLEEGFWKTWRDRIGRVTLPHLLDQMRHHGQIDALALDQRTHRGRELADHWYWGGSVFWDSDLAKWLEASSAWLEHTSDPDLEAQVETIIQQIGRAQRSDGYFNTHILTWRPNHRWKNLRDLHELYCAGHLIEAAVVHFEATGRRTLLDIAQKYADYLVQIFGEHGIRGYGGHPEIELALIRLYRLTREEQYLRLAQFFIEERGRTPNYFEEEAIRRLDAKPFRPNHPESPFAYMQAHVPIRQQPKIVGHAVRAMYLLCAVADLAAETGDQSLKEVAEQLWQDAVCTKLYITGGLGTSGDNEGFTTDFDLPNQNAYAETCASIGFFLLGHRLLQFGPDRQYADLMERALYNNILSGIGLDGRSFFYDNPLSSGGEHRRVDWPWWCPCCPANLARLISSLSSYLYSESAEGFAIHHYVNSQTAFAGLRLQVQTELPFGGRTTISFTEDGLRAAGGSTASEATLLLRVPEWSSSAWYKINSEERTLDLSRGYARIARNWQAGDRLELALDLPVRNHYARYEVAADRGRVALSRGPLIYCFEQTDNGERLDQMVIPDDRSFGPVAGREKLESITLLQGEILRETSEANSLYATEPPKAVDTSATAIPYFAWANRSAGEMQVWMRRTAG